MAGFNDISEPTTLLTAPRKPEEFSQGALLDVFNAAGDLMSPTYWITEAYNLIFGYNPLDEVYQWFAGDWESFAECAEVWTNLGKAVDAVADNVKAGNGSLDATWNGRAADSAYVYFDELTTKLAGQKESYDGLAETYTSLAQAAYYTAEAIKGYVDGIIDGLIIVGIELAAGTLLSWTGVGAVVGYGLAALEIANILRMWAQATQTFTQAQQIVLAAVGTSETIGATIHSTFQSFPVPGASYDHPDRAIA